GPGLGRRARHGLLRGQLAHLELPVRREARADCDRGPAGGHAGRPRRSHPSAGAGHDLPGGVHAGSRGIAVAFGHPSLVGVRASAKADRFTECVIREMTRLAHLHGAVNLSQGFPDFAAPEEVKEADRRAVSADINQYAITWGARSLREAI